MLKGEKVILRAITRDDMARFDEFGNDVEFAILEGNVPWTPTSLERRLARFEEELHRDPPTDRVGFAVEADGKLIGRIGLRDIDRVSGTAELGVAIGDREYWGRGYGRDAVRVLLRYAFLMQNLNRVWLRTGSSNERAIRCYRACGFVQEGILRQHDWSYGGRCDVVCMGILRDEWEDGPNPRPLP